MKKKRKPTTRRARAFRDDASVETAQRTTEKTMGLPEGSVKIVLPSGRKARSDSSIESLRRKYH